MYQAPWRAGLILLAVLTCIVFGPWRLGAFVYRPMSQLHVRSHEANFTLGVTVARDACLEPRERLGPVQRLQLRSLKIPAALTRVTPSRRNVGMRYRE